MRLSELLREEAVRLDLKDLDKWQVIRELTELLVTSGGLAADKKEAVLDALLARERSMSTGMEKGVAIPHCSMEEVDDTLVSLGVSSEGVDFESIDGQATHLVLLLVTPKNRTKVHIRTLAEIAKLLNDADFRDRLIAAKDPAEALARICEREAE